MVNNECLILDTTLQHVLVGAYHPHELSANSRMNIPQTFGPHLTLAPRQWSVVAAETPWLSTRLQPPSPKWSAEPTDFESRCEGTATYLLSNKQICQNGPSRFCFEVQRLIQGCGGAFCSGLLPTNFRMSLIHLVPDLHGSVHECVPGYPQDHPSFNMF